jgi:biotin-dependent carboxylase-like uncharacterized protein
VPSLEKPSGPVTSLDVVDGGLFTLLVDFGRPRSRSLGVPLGGAADRFALAIGNALVGNEPDACALEISLAGLTLRSEGDCACVAYGAPFEIMGPGRQLRAGATFTLHSGEQLHIGGTQKGMRCYLCVAGGFQTPLSLGSRSGLKPLSSGVQLHCATGRIPPRFIASGFEWNREPYDLRVTDGPQTCLFEAEPFYSQEFSVLPVSNRMGIRLSGSPMSVPDRELTSEPVCPGSVQVTRDGQCIVIGVDGQTIGGYPKIAQVISADVDKLAQLRPGDRIRFSRVDLAEAERLYRHKSAELTEWLTRLGTAERFEP